MKESKLEMLENAKAALDKYGYDYRELPNGHLQVGRINYWATSEKYHDPDTNKKGLGLKSLLSYLRVIHPRESEDELITIQLTQEEINYLLHEVNHAIAYRLQNKTRMSELKVFNSAKGALLGNKRL